MSKTSVTALWSRIVPFLASISIEPVFLLDGFAFSNMIVLVEALQFDKICQVNLNFTQELCSNFGNNTANETAYNNLVGNFKRNDGAITSVIPFFFILFIGAWSDKYGRKVPLCLTLFCHMLFATGYLLNAYLYTIPVEFLLFVGFLDSIGGGPVAFLTVSNAYISDVTTTEQRTSKVAFANSLWFLGGPLGTLVGTQIFKSGGYVGVFTTSLVLYLIALIYVMVLLPESHGPFCDKKRIRKISKQESIMRLRDTIIRVYGLSKKKKNSLGETKSEEDKNKSQLTPRKMFFDFFDIRRVIMSFKCVFKKRDGHTRFFICMIILGNFLRKIGRGAYAFYFAKEVLKWDSLDYGYWSTYKNFMSTIGSLCAVPILSTKLKVTDNSLAMIGSLSSVVDYVFYGLVTKSSEFFMWIAPAAALLLNSCSIAMRAMLSKYVNSNELGQVSAVTGTMEGIVPIISTSVYSAITKSTFEIYPASQYFFGAGCNLLMAMIFVLIMIMDKGGNYDVEKASPKKSKGPVVERALVTHTDSNWLFDHANNGKIRLATILLTALNFSIEIPSIENAFSKTAKKESALSTVDEEMTNEGGLSNQSFHAIDEEDRVDSLRIIKKETHIQIVGPVNCELTVVQSETSDLQNETEDVPKAVIETSRKAAIVPSVTTDIPSEANETKNLPSETLNSESEAKNSAIEVTKELPSDSTEGLHNDSIKDSSSNPTKVLQKDSIKDIQNDSKKDLPNETTKDAPSDSTKALSSEPKIDLSSDSTDLQSETVDISNKSIEESLTDTTK